MNQTINTYRQSIRTNSSISFHLDKFYPKFIPFSYCPSMTENQLSSLQVNFFLQKLEKTYRNQKSKAFNYFLCGFIVPAVTSIFAMRFEDISQLSKSVFLVPFSISIGIAGCLALREYSKTPEKNSEFNR